MKQVQIKQKYHDALPSLFNRSFVNIMTFQFHQSEKDEYQRHELIYIIIDQIVKGNTQWEVKHPKP